MCSACSLLRGVLREEAADFAFLYSFCSLGDSVLTVVCLTASTVVCCCQRLPSRHSARWSSTIRRRKSQQKRREMGRKSWPSLLTALRFSEENRREFVVVVRSAIHRPPLSDCHNGTPRNSYAEGKPHRHFGERPLWNRASCDMIILRRTESSREKRRHDNVSLTDRMIEESIENKIKYIVVCRCHFVIYEIQQQHIHREEH